MIKMYPKYVVENKNNENVYIITCDINKEYLLKVSGQDTIIEAIRNEMKWIKSLSLMDMSEVTDGEYRLKVNVDSDVLLDDNDSENVRQSLIKEFQWLKQSGIVVKDIRRQS